MVPLVSGRWKGDTTFYLWVPERMERTDSGTYRGTRDNPTRRAAAVDDADVPDSGWLLEACMTALVAENIETTSGSQ